MNRDAPFLIVYRKERAADGVRVGRYMARTGEGGSRRASRVSCPYGARERGEAFPVRRAKGDICVLIICPITGRIQHMATNNNTVLGIVAHVDAGKTTLAEAMLYLSGKIKKLGRVDHRDSFLDTDTIERRRGITIFSKQAELMSGGRRFTLLDTPGHVDFSSEMERTMQVLDCAVLVVSGSEGVQAHTETLWKLLEKYSVPCFLFITKMDLPGRGREALLRELREGLSESCEDFGRMDGAFYERAALCDEKTMESYLENGTLSDGELLSLVEKRRIFPCFFGSGLKTEGVSELLEGLTRFAPRKKYGEKFSARVFKIASDSQGRRMTFIKCTGGELRVRAALSYRDESGEEREEKVSALRIYSGAKFETTETIRAGDICAVLGLGASYPGQGLGAEEDASPPLLEPVLSYRVLLPEGTDAAQMLPKLRLLQQEDPQLHLEWNERLGEISVRLMGKVQTEVLKSLIKERFDTEVNFDAGRIMYLETIENRVEGVGHFEPLRHYAEVHLILEPLPRGSGIAVNSICSEDTLDRNWQRLILTHLMEKKHLGVLTGAPVTDIKITLAAGRAHLKHTEGGDFRQATYRAVRQGLMQAKSVLLEPWYHFVLELPAEQIGRAISDVRAMGGEFSSPENRGGMTRLEGNAPVSELNEYAEELAAYTRGRGRLSLFPDGYRACHNAESVIEAAGYEAENDAENSADSIFCSHGAGTAIRWDQVKNYMHLESCLKPEREEPSYIHAPRRTLSIDERELEAIMEREFGPIKRPEYRRVDRNEAPERTLAMQGKKRYTIVDGYNLIFAWDELSAFARDNLDLARTRLMDMLSNYCGYTKDELVLVFDGFRTPGNPGSRMQYHNIHVAFTKDGETGDAYIERIADEVGKNYAVRVVTNDNLIRLSALRSGVLRCSSGEFKSEVEWTLDQIDELLRKTNAGAHTTKVKDGKQEWKTKN